MTELAAAKKIARAAAWVARARLPAPGLARRAAGHALGCISRLHKVRVVSGYLPIGDELDPLPAMLALHGLGFRVAAPVIVGRGQPLRFRAWRPDAPLEAGPFGVMVPTEGDWLEPDALLTPMLAFDRRGWRLGYGGGFYDRTLAALRARRSIVALGFAFAGQEVAATPHGPTDVRLDAVVTEAGVIQPE